MKWMFIFVIVCVLFGLSKQTGISTVLGKLNHYIDAGLNDNPSDEVDRLLMQSALFRDVLRTISSQDNELKSLKTRIILQEKEIRKVRNENKEPEEPEEVNTLNRELQEVNTLNQYIQEVNTLNQELQEVNTLNQELREVNTLNQDVRKVNTLNPELRKVNTVNQELKEDNAFNKELKEVKKHNATHQPSYDLERMTIQGHFGSKENEMISNEMNAETEGIDDVIVTNERKLVRGIRAEEYIAFTAYLDHPDTHLGNGQIVKCNQVTLNDGNAYNPLTGLFTVPQVGVYFITFTIHGISTETNIRLVVDGKNLFDAAVYVVRPDSGTQAYQMASNSGVVRLQAGQSLWLEHFIQSGNGAVSGSNTFRHTTFTAFLLY